MEIDIEEKTSEKLRQLGDPSDSFDTIINRIIRYIEFHPECLE